MTLDISPGSLQCLMNVTMHLPSDGFLCSCMHASTVQLMANSQQGLHRPADTVIQREPFDTVHMRNMASPQAYCIYDSIADSTHRKEAGNVAQLVGLQAVNETVLLAEALLKQGLVAPVDVAEPLAQVTIVTAATAAQVEASMGI